MFSRKRERAKPPGFCELFFAVLPLLVSSQVSDCGVKLFKDHIEVRSVKARKAFVSVKDGLIEVFTPRVMVRTVHGKALVKAFLSSSYIAFLLIRFCQVFRLAVKSGSQLESRFERDILRLDDTNLNVTDFLIADSADSCQLGAAVAFRQPQIFKSQSVVLLSPRGTRPRGFID